MDRNLSLNIQKYLISKLANDYKDLESINRLKKFNIYLVTEGIKLVSLDDSILEKVIADLIKNTFELNIEDTKHSYTVKGELDLDLYSIFTHLVRLKNKFKFDLNYFIKKPC